ncbi:hypothetical protein AMECASPLE_014488 [Ameca splendens]|uniref:Uncharacterized protein n=1 Tax=Ameca splendens TaxID=208324 RepID=A0ABV0ZY44_9TELE
MLRGDPRASERLTKTTGLDSRLCGVSDHHRFTCSEDDDNSSGWRREDLEEETTVEQGCGSETDNTSCVMDGSGL